MYIGGLIYGDLTNDEVGIGTTSPDAHLHVFRSSGACLMELESNSGRPLLKLDAGGTTLNSEIQFEKNGSYMGAIGYNNNDSNIFLYEDGSMVFRNGQLGILHTTPSYTLQLPNNSSTGVAMAYDWDTYSDKRVKSQIEDLDYGLKDINKIRPRSYLHHSQKGEDDLLDIDYTRGTYTIGMIAQELYEVIPEAVSKPENEDEELWGINYDRLVPVLIKGVQELSEQNEDLQQKYVDLQRKYEELIAGMSQAD